MNGHFPIGDINPIKYFLGLSIVIGLLFAFISAESDAPFLLKLFQWQLQSLIPISLLITSQMLLSNSGLVDKLSPFYQTLFSGVLGSSLFTPIALIIDIFVMQEGLRTPFLLELADEWLAVTPPIVMAWLLMNAPWLLGFKFVSTDHHSNMADNKTPSAIEYDAASPAHSNQYHFATLLSSNIQGQVLALSAELHYLNVYTVNGKQLILYSLREAINELDDSAGMQVHRSHWVAYDSIVKFEKDGRQGKLLLNNDVTLPVSRNYVAMVKNKLNDRKQ